MDGLRAPLCGHCRTGAAGRAGARGAVWVFARNALDFDWRNAWRGGSRLSDPVLFGSSWRKIPGPNGSGRGGSVCRVRRAGEHSGHHGDSSCRAGAGGGQSSGRELVGTFHHRRHDPDRDSHGRWHEAKMGRHEGDQRIRSGRSSACGARRAVDSGHSHRGLVPVPRNFAGVDDHGLWPACFRAAGLAVARAARLSELIFENRGRRVFGHRDSGSRPAAADALADEIHRRDRPGFCGSGFPVLFYHDRLWSRLGVPRHHCLWHDAEIARPGKRHPPRRLRRDDHGNACCDHGPHCRVHDAAR